MHYDDASTSNIQSNELFSKESLRIQRNNNILKTHLPKLSNSKLIIKIYEKERKIRKCCQRSAMQSKLSTLLAPCIIYCTILGIAQATNIIPYRTSNNDDGGSVAIPSNINLQNNVRPSRRCEPITIPLCQRIGYNMTHFPNAYGHERQEEAGLEVHQFYPLVEVNCYKHLNFFLCSMYTPICQDNYDLSVMPCREVCTEARKKCEPLMQKYGFRWPATLECDDRLPKMSEQEHTGRICAAPPDTIDSDNPNKEVTENRKISKEDTTKMPISPTIASIDGLTEEDYYYLNNKHCFCRCTRPFYALPKNIRNNIKVQNVSHCAHSCYSSSIYSPENRTFFNTWISIWSGICLLLSAFSVLTFLIDVDRFLYPERPIFFLSLCQLMVAIGYILRIFFGHERIACDGPILKIWSGILAPFSPSNSSALFDANSEFNSDILCLLTFIFIYFFGMCASAWWVVLSLSWVLAAVPHWSTEWIAKYSNWFHLFAWATPALQTLIVMYFNAIDGDPITGICYVGNTSVSNLRIFVFGPLILYFLIGVSFLFVGFLNLWGIRSNLKKTHPGVDKTSKLTQLMSKIGIFSVLYTVPAIFVILVIFYEQSFRDTWEQSQLCPCAQKIDNQNGMFLLLALVRSASMLVVGWTSGVWIISTKTLQSWRRLFNCVICAFDCCDREARLRRRQGYVPAINKKSNSNGIINGIYKLNNVGNHQLIHEKTTPMHHQFQSSTLPYTMASEHFANNQYQHVVINNSSQNSPFHVYQSTLNKHPQMHAGYADGCMNPIPCVGKNVIIRHCTGTVLDKSC